MLGRALKAQLILLAADPRDPLAARVRREVGAREATCYIRHVRSLILATPEMAAQLCAWLDAELPPRVRRLHRLALASLYEPALPSEPEQELFDYFEDAYLLGTVCDVTVRQAVPPLLRSTEAFRRQIPRWLESARVAFPAVTERIEETAFA